MANNKQTASWWIIVAFMIVPLVTSFVSTIHVVSFFELSNYATLAIILAVAFELGALSSLAGLVAMEKISKSTVWTIFILLTAFQMMGNTYYSYDTTTTKMISDSHLIKNFTELFGFDIYDNSDVIFVKRIIAIFSGAILPVISLCFLHLLMSYVMKSSKIEIKSESDVKLEPVKESEIISSELENSTENIEPISPVKQNFDEHVKSKIEKLEKDRVNYSELLKILYKDGSIQEGQELPTFKEFVEMVDSNLYNIDTIKMFLTLCNYLNISKVSKDMKIALKSYEEAKTTLEGYLTLNIQ
jgi:hypothetical protein